MQTTIEIKSTATLFADYKIPTCKKSRKTERGEFIDYFLEKINTIRRHEGYKELQKSAIAYFLSVYNVEQLYLLRLKCDQAKNWGKTFNYFVFPKNGDK